jgi:hypothetical protein
MHFYFLEHGLLGNNNDTAKIKEHMGLCGMLAKMDSKVGVKLLWNPVAH